MQTIEPTEHLRRKLALLDERSVRRWPRWENDDYIAVAFLLDDVAARIEELEQEIKRLQANTAQAERQARQEAEGAFGGLVPIEADDDPEEVIGLRWECNR